MPGNEIKVDGAILFGYIQWISEIIADLSDLLSRSAQPASELVFSGKYQGEALDEICTFYKSMEIHIGRLASFYGKAAEYVGYAFEQMKYTDDEIATALLNYLDSQTNSSRTGSGVRR